jgi:hypothetical protein
MTKKQLKLYERVCKHVRETLGGYRDGNVGGVEVSFEASKGTWYAQGHGYLDDLVRYDELPIALLPNVQDEGSAPSTNVPKTH